MTISFYPQEFRKVLGKLEDFESYSLSFLKDRNDSIRFYNAEKLMFNVLITISKLSYQLKEYALIGGKHDELWNGVVKSLDIIEEGFESLSVNVSEAYERMLEELLKIWQLYDEVYKELKNVLGFDLLHEFDLDEKLETICERRECGEYYLDEDY